MAGRWQSRNLILDESGLQAKVHIDTQAGETSRPVQWELRYLHSYLEYHNILCEWLRQCDYLADMHTRFELDDDDIVLSKRQGGAEHSHTRASTRWYLSLLLTLLSFKQTSAHRAQLAYNRLQLIIRMACGFMTSPLEMVVPFISLQAKLKRARITVSRTGVVVGAPRMFEGEVKIEM